MTDIKTISILFFFSGILLFSCQSTPETETATTGTDTAPSAGIPTVRVVEPQRRAFEGSFTLTGTAMPDKSVTVYALEGGQVRRMLADIGQWVTKGQTLARLTNPEISRQYEMAKVAAKYAKKEYDRLKGIQTATPDLVSIREVEAAEAKYEIKNAALHAISNRMAQLSVRAPFSGTVSKRYVDAGALVQNALKTGSATPLVDIQDASTIRLTIYMPESDVSYVSKGTAVTIHFPELGGKEYQGRVTRTSGALDPLTKNMTVEIDIPNKAHRIKPGMFARVDFVLATKEEVLSLPQEALVLKNDATYVYVVKGGFAHLKEIKKGLEDKEHFQVISGVTPGDKIVVKGKNTIRDGVKVQMVK